MDWGAANSGFPSKLTTLQMNPEKREMLPKMAFTGFLSRYREPTLKEGFRDITKVDFKVCGLAFR